ncbi:Ig-like domain-containing protein [Bacillus sp. AFS017336]|uniref:Ig-like domain-containing protein n=1 Tax=Bacillus sp. AFS017336 TaxID=2033489 RepID=UPI000BF04E34|nr:Ig-like domain-containing protein [Bacillus sp. AFS017336]PEL08370.1 hypothetical protein CN601_16740 [Bacillus sp. AFS017336]
MFTYVAATQKNAAAGDVNGDGVIDVLDVKQVAKKFGVKKATNFNIEDLNQDGIVDTQDMAFLVGNLYKSNPDATITPKEMVDGRYSTDYFNVLGISTLVNTLKATTKTNHTVTLNWLAAVDATNMKIEQSSDNGATWTAATTSNPVAVDANSTVVTGLTENTSYKFRVNVTGGLNAGVSNVATATTDISLAPNAPVVKGLGDNETSISGKAEPNVTITVKKDGNVIATGTANEAGDFTLPLDKQKAGTVLTISAANADGKVSKEVSITVLDRTAPKAPVVKKVDDNDYAVTGTTEANATVFVRSTKGMLGSSKADSKGNFKVTIASQKAGTVLTVTASDKDGNVSKAVSINVIDMTAPLAPSVKPVTDHDKFVSGTTEGNATVTVKRNGVVIGKEQANKNGKFYLEIGTQKAGTVLTFSASDEAGNVSAQRKVTVLDRTAPKTPKISSFVVDSKKHQLRMSGSAEAGSTLVVKIGTKIKAKATVSSKGTFKATLSNLSKGTNTITLYVVDKAGNVSGSVKRTITVK